LSPMEERTCLCALDEATEDLLERPANNTSQRKTLRLEKKRKRRHELMTILSEQEKRKGNPSGGQPAHARGTPGTQKKRPRVLEEAEPLGILWGGLERCACGNGHTHQRCSKHRCRACCSGGCGVATHKREP